MNIKRLLAIPVMLLAVAATAKVVLPQLFQDGMVVQRNKPIPVWGKASAGEHIIVTLNKKACETTADADGRWRVDLPQMKAGGPFVLKVTGTEPTDGSARADGAEGVSELVVTDVLIGDVWLCSGQSNIDVTVERVYPWYTETIDGYENLGIRLFRVQNETDTHGMKDDIRPTSINWKPVTKHNAWHFSAVGYFLGKRMFEKSGVPQGIIVNSWGGTPIEAWVAADSLRQDYPLLVEKTRFYDNPEYVKAQMRANQQADQRWNALLNEKDPGLVMVDGTNRFTALDYDDAAWAEANQYASDWAFATDGTTATGAQPKKHPVVGSLWLRQHVTIDKAHAGKPARLLLGTLFDADYTYVNGRQVGVTYYQYPPRRYDVPEGLLREGDNVITVRFVNKCGVAHFIKEKPYLLAFGDDRFSLNPLPRDIVPLAETWKYHAGAEMPPCPSGDVSLQNLPATLYNAVVYPLAPYALSGVVWYQGESNTGNPAPYEAMLTKLVNGWRQLWQQPQLPFVVVQLANYMQPSEQPQESAWARVREAQRQVATKLPHVGLATAIDLGETVDIHPLRKRELADRIGRCFDKLVYKDKKSVQMPMLLTAKAGDGQAILTFDQPLRPGELQEFEVAGDDGRFQNVAATADGCRIVVSSSVDRVRWVRHAWKDNPIRLNAYSVEGLPVPPFEVAVDE